LEYRELMEQCWDADPTKRPHISSLLNKIKEMNRINYQNEEQQTNNSINSTNINSNPQINTDYNMSFSFNNSFFSSRVYKFKNLPQPRNATKGKILNIIYYAQ